MANSIHKDRFGPDWPLGLITVAASGTPVSIMSVVDPSSLNAPGTATPGTAGANEYSVLCQQILFTACKSVGPVVDNTGAIYVLRAPAGSGTGNKTDSGVIIAIIQPGFTFALASAPMTRETFSPYRYFIDADTTADGCLVTLII